MFNSEFYPTPQAVIEQMTFGLDLFGKTVLEPSAGKGDIVSYLKNLGANVIVCENNNDLAKICSQKADRFLESDFFKVSAEQISHIDFIIMNPPFSNADKHIQHAWEIAPEGCEIIALCNAQTIENRYSYNREILKELVDKHGKYENLGNVFSEAERTTEVDIALIHLFKPKTGESEFDNYFFDMNEEQEEMVNGSGIVKHNEIREIVNRYVGAVKMFDSVINASVALNSLIMPISNHLDIKFGAYHSQGSNHTPITRDSFKKDLQRSAWDAVFEKMNMEKYLTKGIKADINKFVEQQQKVPFTMANIFKMIELIAGTHNQRMDRVLIEAFDKICSLSADNSEAGEKWKTNSNYKVNKRFILNWVCECDERWSKQPHVKVRYNSNADVLDDIVKALCLVTGKNYDSVMDLEVVEYGYVKHYTNRLSSFFSYNKVYWREWVQWNEFFKVKGFKKGTLHVEFVNEEVWWLFNQSVSKIKGWVIPQKTDKKQKGTEKTKSNKVEVYE